jgi:hypothetical protein
MAVGGTVAAPPSSHSGGRHPDKRPRAQARWVSSEGAPLADPGSPLSHQLSSMKEPGNHRAGMVEYFQDEATLPASRLDSKRDTKKKRKKHEADKDSDKQGATEAVKGVKSEGVEAVSLRNRGAVEERTSESSQAPAVPGASGASQSESSRGARCKAKTTTADRATQKGDRSKVTQSASATSPALAAQPSSTTLTDPDAPPTTGTWLLARGQWHLAPETAAPPTPSRQASAPALAGRRETSPLKISEEYAASFANAAAATPKRQLPPPGSPAATAASARSVAAADRRRRKGSPPPETPEDPAVASSAASPKRRRTAPCSTSLVSADSLPRPSQSSQASQGSEASQASQPSQLSQQDQSGAWQPSAKTSAVPPKHGAATLAKGAKARGGLYRDPLAVHLRRAASDPHSPRPMPPPPVLFGAAAPMTEIKREAC